MLTAIAIVVAGYAAVVSTIHVVYTIYSQVRPRVKVSASYGRLGVHGKAAGKLFSGGRFVDDEDLGNEVVTIRAINTGHKPVTLAQLAFRTKDKQVLVLMLGDDVPNALTTGQLHSSYAHAARFREQLRGREPDYPFAKDVEGRVYKGDFDDYFADWLTHQ